MKNSTITKIMFIVQFGLFSALMLGLAMFELIINLQKELIGSLLLVPTAYIAFTFTLPFLVKIEI